MQKKVLVVDDMPDVVKLVAKMLGESGYEVLEATTGSDALGILQSEAIDVLITDVRMPRMSGPELVQRSWEFAPDLPVVFMTGYSVADEISCEMLSRTLLVTKPFTVRALRSAIGQALSDGNDPAASERRDKQDGAAARGPMRDPTLGTASGVE